LPPPQLCTPMFARHSRRLTTQNTGCSGRFGGSESWRFAREGLFRYSIQANWMWSSKSRRRFWAKVLELNRRSIRNARSIRNLCVRQASRFEDWKCWIDVSRVAHGRRVSRAWLTLPATSSNSFQTVVSGINWHLKNWRATCGSRSRAATPA